MTSPNPAKDIAIIIPAYNESATIRDIAMRSLAICPQVIVVDDGSSDDTSAQLDGLPLQLIQHANNQGKAASLWDGIQRARSLGATYLVTLDGDGQHAPEDIPRLLAQIPANPSHIIIGARLADKSAIPAKRYYANRIANFWLAWAAGYPLSDSQSGFRVYPVSLFDDLKISTSRHSSFVFESEILIKAAQRGIYSTAVAIPAVYTEHARPSHFRGVRDISLITLMVARSLLSRCLYPQGLFRAVIKPRLLPAHAGRADYAGYLMALLSLFIVLCSGGITLLLAIIHIWRTGRRAQTSADGLHVVVLGKRLHNSVPDYDYRLRLQRAVALYRAQNTRTFYLLGGRTGDAEISESFAGEQFLKAEGIPSSQVWLEQTSRNTLENIRQLRNHHDIPSQKIVLVSNRYHLARASTMARPFGYRTELCAAEQDKATTVTGAFMYIAEGILLHWYLTGFLYAKLTRNQTMLTRISR